MGYRVAAGLWAGLFFWAAVLQLNDPGSPIAWFTIYLLPSLLSLVVVAGRPAPRWASGGISALAALGLVLIAVTYDGLGEPMDHGPGGSLAYEVVREGMGLLIILSWTLTLLIRPEPAKQEDAGKEG